MKALNRKKTSGRRASHKKTSESKSANEELTTVNDEMDIDALKRGEQAIAAAHDFAANTLETLRESLVVLDGQLRVESANRSFYRTFGLSPEQTVGNVIHDLGNGQWDIPKLRALLEEILPQHKTMENFEVEHDFAIGRRTLLLNARRIEDPTRTTHRILLAIEDITERKRLQQQVESAHLAEVIIATARDPLLILNSDLRVHMANEAFYNTFKVSPAESEGRMIYDLGNRQWNIPKLRQLLEDVLPRNSIFNDFEVTHDFERIGHRSMLLNGRPLAGDGAPERILLGIQDITEVLQFQAAARESQEKFKLLFEHSPLPKWVFELDTLRFVDVNQAAVQHYGYSREEFLRMIDLKKEINDLCRQQGKAERYPLDFEQGEKETGG